MSRENETKAEDENGSIRTLLMLNNDIRENKEDTTLIWFNPVIGETIDIEKKKEALQAVNDFILFLSDINECINNIKSIRAEKIFLIVAGNNADELLPSVKNLFQLDSIFIFPRNSQEFERLRIDYLKIVGIFDNFDEVIQSLSETIKYVEKKIDVVSFYDEQQQDTRDLAEHAAKFLW